MGWEVKNGRRYYYRKVREGPLVRSVYCGAGESIKHSFWARAYYESQRAKGKGHHAAVRALSFKWVRIIFRCWQAGTAYVEVRYLESLRRKGSSLLTYAAQNPS